MVSLWSGTRRGTWCWSAPRLACEERSRKLTGHSAQTPFRAAEFKSAYGPKYVALAPDPPHEQIRMAPTSLDPPTLEPLTTETSAAVNGH
ncbi:hypothetical protein O9K51_01972 [Purpureocillium lavendulum]|uniref:Uncharacterized protein n=1 Tax=Purpureocillium lavendulum TaxID=1247861 RepID=A0AB34G8V3_9HYPO|nr:hypothetical protein O9K51_01972 [Purpureocillium lavendulum]